MKKPIIIAAGAACVALAYPATSWFLGQRLEASLDEHYKLLENYPYVKVVQRDFQRGLFSSTETVTLELFNFGALEQTPAAEAPAVAETPADAPAGDAQPAPAPAAPPAPPKPIRITLQSQYQHGPFPGFSTLAAATSETELVLDAEQQQAVSKVFGDQKPLQIHGVYRFDGGGTSTMESPAIAFTPPADQNPKGLQISWKGIRVVTDFAAGMKQYSMKAEAPGLEMKNKDGETFDMAGLHLESEQQRLFDDVPLFYTGSGRFTLDSATFNGTTTTPTGEEKKQSFKLAQLVYEASIPANGDFIDIIGKINAQTITADQDNYGPAGYEFSLRHLHARTAATLYASLMKIYGDPGKLVADKKAGKPLQAFENLKAPALELLKYGPEVRIDRISFNSPKGEAKISASAKLGELKQEELENPFALIGKLNASADIAMPEGLISEKASPDMINTYVDQGFVQRDGAILRSTIAFANGQLTVNGKPFNPMAPPPPAAAQ